MNDYPTYTVKVTIQTHYNLTNNHKGLTENHIIPIREALTEMDAVKAALDALRERYYELECEEDE